MAYCVEHAVPHSVFLGRAVGPGEPLWLPEDRAKTIAYQLEKAAVCVRCGTASWEHADDPNAYEAIAEFCHGCYLLRRAEEGSTEVSTPGFTMRLVPRAVAAKLRDAPKPGVRRRRREHRRD